MESYDWTQFHVHMFYRAPLTEVFDRFATGAGLASFYIRNGTFTAPDGTIRPPDERFATGDSYHFDYLHDYAHGGVVHAVEDGRLVSFSFGPCDVTIRFRSVDGVVGSGEVVERPDGGGTFTEVDLHQTSCPTEDPERAWLHLNCRSCWIYFMTNLRSVLAGGPDIRDHEFPELNDSVSIGWGAPEV